MIKKTFILALIIMICFLSGSCIDYTGLDQMNIIVGVAIDKDILTGNYILTFETVDMTVVAENQMKPALIESQGESIFDAARNAKLRLINKPYFGNIETIILSHQIAEDENGITEVLDLFLRGSEARETNSIIISQEKTAAEILKASPINTSFVSTGISETLREDAETTAKSYDVQLYEAYNTWFAEGTELVIPAFNCVTNDEKPAAEANGVAVFKDTRLIGYLPPDETKYFLFIMNEIKGGVIVFKTKDDVTVTMEIHKSSTKKFFTYADDRFKYTIQPKTTVFISEMSDRVHLGSEAVRERVIADAEEFLIKNITTVIKKAQIDYHSDIFGFGSMVYRKDPKLWNKIKKDWDSYFQSLEFEIKPEIEILNTGMLKH